MNKDDGCKYFADGSFDLEKWQVDNVPDAVSWHIALFMICSIRLLCKCANDREFSRILDVAELHIDNILCPEEVDKFLA